MEEESKKTSNIVPLVVVIVLVICIFVFMLVSAGNSEEGKPTQAVETLFAAMRDGNDEAFYGAYLGSSPICYYETEGLEGNTASVEAFLYKIRQYTFEVLEEDIRGSEAVVTLYLENFDFKGLSDRCASRYDMALAANPYLSSEEIVDLGINILAEETYNTKKRFGVTEKIKVYKTKNGWKVESIGPTNHPELMKVFSGNMAEE